MKQIVLLLGTLVIAANMNLTYADSLYANSPMLKALGSAWRSHQTLHPDNRDITIVYGGEDLSSDKPTTKSHTTVA